MNILYVVNDASLNGGNMSLLNLLDALCCCQTKFRPVVLLPYPGPFSEALKERKIPCLFFPFRTFVSLAPHSLRGWCVYIVKFLSTLLNFFAVPFIVLAVKKYKIGLIHTNVSVLNVGLRAARICNIPHVWSLREMQIGMRPFCSREKMRRMFYASDLVLCVSQSVADHFGLQASNVKVLWDTVAPGGGMEPCDEKEPFFLVCGTISPVKGFDLALQGYQIFLKKYPEYVDHKLVIAGSFIRGLESYSQQIRDFIEKNSLADQVKFVGYRKNIQAYMRKASAFIMSSRNEGFGRVTVEAMLNSCPVVGYDAGGTAELLQRGGNGVLFSSPEELADSLGRLLHNPEETRTIAARAKTFADLHFSDQNYIDHLSAFYDERLSPRGGGGKA